MPAKDSFATRQLEKHGWNDGKGLGRLENGIKDAIKVKRKNNTGGLGHDHGEQFTFHWWDHVFNKAANSIKVTSDGEDIKIEKDKNAKKIQPMLISTKKPLRKSFAGKPLLYGTFVKAGTYHNDEEINDDTESDSSSDEEDFSAKDTLEKTFKLTGLTGHKAARHGHKLGGKLQRVQEQEYKESCIDNNKCSVDENEKETNQNTSANDNAVIPSKKKKSKLPCTEDLKTSCKQNKKRKKADIEDLSNSCKQNKKNKKEDIDLEKSKQSEKKKSKKKKQRNKESK